MSEGVFEGGGGADLKLEPRAKLNLCLWVTGFRPDGYHELLSLVHTVELSDSLTLSIGEMKPFKVSGLPGAPTSGDNLVIKALKALEEERGRKLCLSAALEKNIPAGSGLGGGSSDAAAALLGADRLCSLGLSSERLSALGARVGSDVPLFLSGSAAGVIEGRGERVTPVRSTLSGWTALYIPALQNDTAEAYDALRREGAYVTPLQARNGLERAVRYTEEGEIEALGGVLFNSFEPWCLKRDKHARRAVERMKEAGAVGVSVTGTGSCWFGLFTDRPSGLGEQFLITPLSR